MTEVAFHFNVPDRLDYFCRLLRKAFANGSQVVVVGDEAQMNRLDSALWAFSALDFVPHCRLPADAVIARKSPVVLTESVSSVPHQQVLVNCGNRVPAGFEQFERLIEVVTADEEDRAQARQRWKHYSDRGYPITRHDLN
jgi:DNA polymerase-3 subunit chi